MNRYVCYATCALSMGAPTWKASLSSGAFVRAANEHLCTSYVEMSLGLSKCGYLQDVESRWT